MDDRDLLCRYVRDCDEAAFTQLVQTHLNFVYAAALRQVGGDTHLAEDVIQQVFVDFARKASSLAGHPVLQGWLFTSARFAAAKAVLADLKPADRDAVLLRFFEKPGLRRHCRPTADRRGRRADAHRSRARARLSSRPNSGSSTPCENPAAREPSAPRLRFCV